MRLISISLNGLGPAMKLGLGKWMRGAQADLYCLVNTCAGYPELDDDSYLIDGYYEYFFPCGEDGKGGVALYARALPKAIIHELGFAESDHHGRYMQADYDSFSVGAVCLPGSVGLDQDREAHQSFRKHYLAHLIKQSRKRRPFVVMGDFAMAHTWRDLDNPDDSTGVPGFLIEEQTWFDEVMRETGVVDVMRDFFPEDLLRDTRDSGNRTWRSNYVLASEGLMQRISDAGLVPGPTPPGARAKAYFIEIDDEPPPKHYR